MQRKNIIVFGETGSGKSSVINLILGRQAARVSDSAVGCTFKYDKYESSDGSYVLYDTVGLSEGKNGTVSSTDAIKQLVSLLKSLADGVSVSLLIYVIKKDRIRETTEKNYRLFVNDICMNSVPAILVITNCELEKQAGTWWRENKSHFDGYRMNFVDVISGCAGDPDSVIEELQPRITRLRAETKCKLEASIASNGLAEPWKMKSWMNWLQRIIAQVWNTICSWLGLTDAQVAYVPRLKEVLMRSGNLSEAEATRLANEIADAIQ